MFTGLVNFKPPAWDPYEYAYYFTLLFSIVFWVGMLSCSILAIVLAKWQPHPMPQSREVAQAETPRQGSVPVSSESETEDDTYVSVLRPLCGLEYKLEENLESSFLQDYTKFELIFSVSNPTDPCIPLVKRLILRYPEVDAKLIVDPSQTGINPKVTNLIRAYESSKYDVVWVCDSNVLLSRGCLRRSVKPLRDPKVGLVHHLPLGISPTTFGAQLDAVFLNTAHAKMYSVLNFLKVGPCVIGKSCLYRKSDLADVGGLRTFMDRLAEDQLVGAALWGKGLAHRMTGDLAYNRLGSLSTANYFNRRSRWCRLRKFVVPEATLFEPFSESIVNGLLGCYFFKCVLGVPPIMFMVGHLALWFLLDLQLMCSFSPHPLRGAQLRATAAAWAVRELSAFPVFLYSVLGSTFLWRGQTYRITKGTRVLPTSSSPNHLVSRNGPYWTTQLALSLFSWIDSICDTLVQPNYWDYENGVNQLGEADSLLNTSITNNNGRINPQNGNNRLTVRTDSLDNISSITTAVHRLSVCSTTAKPPTNTQHKVKCSLHLTNVPSPPSTLCHNNSIRELKYNTFNSCTNSFTTNNSSPGTNPTSVLELEFPHHPQHYLVNSSAADLRPPMFKSPS